LRASDLHIRIAAALMIAVGVGACGLAILAEEVGLAAEAEAAAGFGWKQLTLLAVGVVLSGTGTLLLHRRGLFPRWSISLRLPRWSISPRLARVGLVAGGIVLVGCLVFVTRQAADDELTFPDHLIGILALVLFVGPVWWSVVVWRRHLLPAWQGPLARLAEAVAAAAILLLAAEALGAVGLFGPVPLVIGGMVSGGTAVILGKMREPPAQAAGPPRASEEGRFMSALAGGVAVAVGMAYALNVLLALGGPGIIDFDSLWYHLPVAADFVQERSLLGLTDVGNLPSSFYPFNGELLHAIGIALLGHDALSPALNVLWLAVALLAGWSIGLPFGRSRLTLIATATATVTPLLVGTNAGTANVDLMALAFALAAAAFLVNARGAFWPILLAFLSIGMVVGSKLPMIPTAAALGVLAIFVISRERRLRWGGWALVCVLLTGSFWYVRNAFHVGNPIPWMGLDLGLLTLPKLDADPVDCTLTPLLHWLDDSSVLDQHIVPELRWYLGSLWPGVLAASVLGPAAAVAFDRRPPVRMLAAIALVGWLAYLVTPATGGEHNAGSGVPSCFGFNLRFAIAPLTFGMVVALLAVPRKLMHVALAAIIALFIVTLLESDRPQPESVPWVVPIGFGISACLMALWRPPTERQANPYRPPNRSRSFALLGFCFLGAVAVTLPIINGYLDERYRDDILPYQETPLEEVSAWMRSVDNASIGLGGFTLSYPLYGVQVTNSVSYVSEPDSADPFSHPDSCDEWRAGLTDGGFDYVVTTPLGAQAPPPAERAWTRGDDRAREILSAGPLSVFSFDARQQAQPCDDRRSSAGEEVASIDRP
jgi:hypothetical protein